VEFALDLAPAVAGQPTMNFQWLETVHF